MNTAKKFFQGFAIVVGVISLFIVVFRSNFSSDTWVDDTNSILEAGKNVKNQVKEIDVKGVFDSLEIIADEYSRQMSEQRTKLIKANDPDAEVKRNLQEAILSKGYSCNDSLNLVYVKDVDNSKTAFFVTCNDNTLAYGVVVNRSTQSFYVEEVNSPSNPLLEPPQ